MDEVKKKVGRPVGSTKFTEEFINELSVKLLVWIKEPTNFWIGTFAVENGFHRHRINEFAQRNEEFKSALEIAKQHQENKLFLLGMNNQANVTMCIFALKNVAGWRDNKIEEADEELKETEIVFTGVPMKNGAIPEKYSRYLN